MLPHLRSIQSRRLIAKPRQTPRKDLKVLEEKISQKYIVLQEVKEVIDLPVLDGESPDWENAKQPELDKEVVQQLRHYVTVLAALYEHNPFHCWEHACHVTTSMSKSLARIVKPDRVSTSQSPNSMHHRYTYGISDPRSQLALLMAALCHDANHPGVPNPILIKENPTLSKYYNGKSLAEQNSVDLAWEALMSSDFDALRSSIYCNEDELRQFRAIIVNSIMATDIFDPELSALRKKRWNKVFAEDNSDDAFLSHEEINRKATLVIEHLIQASDVAHTMQHWDIYLKWNAHLFQEMHAVYSSGRSDKDPSAGWYKGELWFFDNYVIPLAKKLKECQVFGVSSHEYLNYAMSNRREWELQGEQIVADLLTQVAPAAVEVEQMETTED